MNFTIPEKLKKFAYTLSSEQKKNWDALIKFMFECDSDYDHSDFNPNEYAAYCALSYAIQAELIEYQGNEFDSYEAVTNKVFGKDAFDYIFSYNDATEDFFNFFKSVYGSNATLDNVNSRFVAEILEKIIHCHNNEQKITVHWKTNVKDRFPSLDSFREFLELNPHRKNSYRKIILTKKVERIVYDEVEEVITL